MQVQDLMAQIADENQCDLGVGFEDVKAKVAEKKLSKE